ncbi:MAG TPA: hypothetical protein VM164_05755 [Burkholderiales bacterium]|nr:hypothetical protein [Burkholderiales bacterium]
MKHFAIPAAAALIVLALPAQAGGVSNELLLSSAWCSFSYNKTTGYSSSKRVSFSPDGRYSSGARREGGSSGPQGSVYSQSDGSGGGRWRIERGELYMSEGGGFEHVQTLVTRNNNGYPIIVADGIEYSQCR